jgi:hypothetical protein
MSKTWQFPGNKIPFIQPDNKSKNITLYGGITELQGLFFFQ